MDFIELKIDKDANAAYYRFSRNKVAETVEIEESGFEDYIIDIDEDGVMVGVEVLNYSDHAKELDKGTDVWNHLNEYPGFHLQ